MIRKMLIISIILEAELVKKTKKIILYNIFFKKCVDGLHGTYISYFVTGGSDGSQIKILGTK